MAKTTDIGGLKPGEMEEFSKENLIVPPAEAGTDIITRFARKVCNLIASRQDKEDGQFAAFLLTRKTVLPHSCVSVPLVKNGNDPISGRVWLVSHDMGGKACHLEQKCTTQDQIFSTVKEAGFSDLSLIVVDWRNGRTSVMLFPMGLKDADEYVDLYMETEPISSDVFKAALDKIYYHHFRTPHVGARAHQDKIWMEAKNGIPAERPEERIHARLFTSLKMAFPAHDVRSETDSEEGRADLHVFTYEHTISGHQAMRVDWLLELKALCDKTSTGQPKGNPTCAQSMNDGYIQITSYREKFKPVRSAICCFDMRMNDDGDDKCFEAVAEKAIEAEIYLWRWFLYRSTKAARSADRSQSAKN